MLKFLFAKKRLRAADTPGMYNRFLAWENRDHVIAFLNQIESTAGNKAYAWRKREDLKSQKLEALLYGEKKAEPLLDFTALSQHYPYWKKTRGGMTNQVFADHEIFSWQFSMFGKKARVTHHFHKQQLFLVEFDLKYLAQKEVTQFLSHLLGPEEDIDQLALSQEKKLHPIAGAPLSFGAYNNVGFKVLLAKPCPGFRQSLLESIDDPLTEF